MNGISNLDFEMVLTYLGDTRHQQPETYYVGGVDVGPLENCDLNHQLRAIGEDWGGGIGYLEPLRVVHNWLMYMQMDLLLRFSVGYVVVGWRYYFSVDNSHQSAADE